MSELPPISTYELLTLISREGAGWPAATPASWGPNETWDAIHREIRAGYLEDAQNLTEQGHRYLLDTRAQQRLPPS